MRRSPLFAPLLGISLALTASPVLASGPYVVLTDDGFIEGHALQTDADATAVQDRLFQLYQAIGDEVPDILSVWTTFPFAGSAVGTYFLPYGAHVKGIGLDAFFPPDGTLTSPHPPLDAILMHNDVTALAQRAAAQHAPADGFANYLFLLELSHRFGPALRVPGATPDELVGFPFHWSFWMDAGGSPSGGNAWTDNGDGTFTAATPAPKDLRHSMLDLYVMGLATKAEVEPFGVLESAVPPASVVDPLWGGAYAAHSFPWFDGTPFTVTATRRQLTIDDVVTATGDRDPAAGQAPTSWKLGIALLVSQNDKPAAIAAAKALFDPLAAGFAPAFHEATSQRGTLDVVTPAEASGTGGSGGGGSGGGTSSSTGTGGGAGTEGGGCGCRTAGGEPGGAGAIALGVAAMAAMRRRRRRG